MCLLKGVISIGLYKYILNKISVLNFSLNTRKYSISEFGKLLTMTRSCALIVFPLTQEAVLVGHLDFSGTMWICKH